MSKPYTTFPTENPILDNEPALPLGRKQPALPFNPPK